MTDPAPRTARRDREQLRRDTLSAAREIIMTEGPAALSARRLAKAVGYAPGTLYNLFDSVPDVLWQLNRENFQQIARIFDDLPDAPPEDRLRSIAARYVALVERETALFRAVFEGPRVTDAFPQWYIEAVDGLLARIAAELHALAPELPPTAVSREASTLFAAVQGISALQVSGRLALVSADPASRLADGLVCRVLRDIRAQGA